MLETVRSRGILNCGDCGAAVAFSKTRPDGSTTEQLDAEAIRLLGGEGGLTYAPPAR
ncbi:MAG: hypothetical protein OXH42_01990 [Acidimicrobiaceae bacterium]|nr:hypothetical protein [Acidimicrobiaceae bacterium]